jgi:integrase
MKNTLREAQLQTLRKRLRGHHLEAMMILALVTGIRRDELRGLTWSDLNLETGAIHVLDSKTKRHFRRITLSQDIIHLLKRHSLHQEEQNRDAGTVRQSFDLVFPDHTGAKRSSQDFLQEWYAVCEHVGLPRLRFHDMRVFLWRQLIKQDGDTRAGHERSLDCDENADEQ